MRIRSTVRWALLVLAIGLAPAPAAADTLVTTSGARFEGAVSFNRTAGTYTVDAPSGSRLTFPHTMVKEVIGGPAATIAVTPTAPRPITTPTTTPTAPVTPTATPTSPTRRTVSSVAVVLRGTVTLNFRKAGADSILSYISTMKKLQIDTDIDVTSSGIHLSDRIMDVHTRSATIESILPAILGEDLGYRIEDDGILITLRKKALPPLTTVHYGEPLASPAPATSAAPTASAVARPVSDSSERLRQIIETVVMGPDVAPWGAEATVKPADTGGYDITQTSRGHATIRTLFQSLHDAAAGHPTGMYQPGNLGATWAILQDRMDASFSSVSLRRALEQFSAQLPKLGLIISPKVAAAGIDLDARTVDLTMRQEMPETVLRAILGKDLGFQVKENYVLVTTHEDALSDLGWMIYPITAPTQKQVLTRVIADVKKTIRADADPNVAAWQEDRGPAMLLPIRDAAIFVLQTPAGQRNVVRALSAWRP